MRTRAGAPGTSWPGLTAALAGVLAILLGLVVLVGWAVHSTFLIQVSPNLAPMQRNTAVSFILCGLALLGIVMGRPRLTLIGSAVTGTLAVITLVEYLFRANLGIDQLLGVAYITSQASAPGRMSPATALCFILLAAGFVWTQSSLRTSRSSMMGLTGLLVAAVGATCGIGILSGAS